MNYIQQKVYYKLMISLSMKITFKFFVKSKLAANITEEQGKTLTDAEGDVLRGLRKLHIFT